MRAVLTQARISQKADHLQPDKLHNLLRGAPSQTVVMIMSSMNRKHVRTMSQKHTLTIGFFMRVHLSAICVINF